MASSVLQKVKFRYCPFCGGDLAINNSFKFCPFCGELLAMDKHTIEINDKVVEKKSTVPMDVVEINEKEGKQYDYYSIILKGVNNKNKLTSRLQTVLLRSVLAIKMAVDNIPSMIVYKGKVDEMEPILQSFMDEGASVSILVDGHNAEPTTNQLFKWQDLLDSEIRDMIRKYSESLWIGDSNFTIVQTERMGEHDYVVLSDQNLYYLAQNETDIGKSTRVISYYLMKDVLLGTNEIEICLFDGTTFSFSFLKEVDAKKTYHLLQRNSKEFFERFLISMECPTCNWKVKKILHKKWGRSLCERCENPLTHKLLII